MYARFMSSGLGTFIVFHKRCSIVPVALVLVN